MSNARLRCATAIVAGAIIAAMSIHPARARSRGDVSSSARIDYRSIPIEGLEVAYREAGVGRSTTVLLLHGVPTSSRMYEGLMRTLGGRYHLVALDYPGFGNSSAPAAADFAYTFDHLATIVQAFLDAKRIDHFVLFMQDYGAPVGMRVAMARPDAVLGMVFQNGNVYDEGLGAIWKKRREYWADRAAHESEIRDGHLSLDVTRARHLGDDPDIAAYDPDLWQDELAFLHRAGEAQIQTDLIYDYRTNIEAYASWQRWLRAHRLPTLVMWGRHDQAFLVAGALAFRRDLPDAQIEILEAGHFAMDTRLDEVSSLTDRFLQDRLLFSPPDPVGR